MTEKVTIGNCELWHGDCRRIEQAYAQPRLFEDAKPAVQVQVEML